MLYGTRIKTPSSELPKAVSLIYKVMCTELACKLQHRGGVETTNQHNRPKCTYAWVPFNVVCGRGVEVMTPKLWVWRRVKMAVLMLKQFYLYIKAHQERMTKGHILYPLFLYHPPSHHTMMRVWHCITYATKSESITQKHISPPPPHPKYMKSSRSSPSVPHKQPPKPITINCHIILLF